MANFFFIKTFDKTYSRRAPKRTQKHYHRALHAHNDFAPVTGGHDHVRGMHGKNSVVNNPRNALGAFKVANPGEYTREAHPMN